MVGAGSMGRMAFSCTVRVVWIVWIYLSFNVEMPALDWGGHSKKSHNTRLKSNRFIWNHELSEHCSFIR